MNASLQIQMLDGDRLHLSEGPIDLIITTVGRRDQVELARGAATARFRTVLGELTSELAGLRRAVREDTPFDGPVARRMAVAASRFLPAFVTPMAAVAGSVADEILAVMLAHAELDKAIVNNGGDIAFHLAPGQTLDAGLVAGPPVPGRALDGKITISAGDGLGGIATSGRHGRSFSLGIADAVSVVARDAATADVAATLIANAVNIESDKIERQPASALDPDSDLGDRLVTVNVGDLETAEIDQALRAGLKIADGFISGGMIEAALLSLGGTSRSTGDRLAITGHQSEGVVYDYQSKKDLVGAGRDPA